MATSPDGSGRQIRILNRLDQIAEIAAFVEAFGSACGLPDDVVNALNLVLDEVVCNAISHGFPDGGQHTITVNLGRDGGDVWAEVVDDGMPFDPLAASAAPDAGKGLHDRKVGGLGLLFIRHLMDDIAYRRDGPLNRLRLRKAIGGMPPRGEDATGATDDR
jgi:anti-sigma regulatory factor (Ser/Thr protein kinase)